ncbi:asparaginase [Alicyclobacillus sp. SO9]|nr:asparaginase [Alicyclobacillus sp. SO9]
MELDETTDSVRTGSVQPLHSVGPMLQRFTQYEMIDLFNVPSPHMTPNMMHELSAAVHRELSRHEVSGVVVTHGTDTIEETAFYLNLTVPSDKPVVFTGAMRSSNELGADGPVNLIQAVRVAAHPFSRGRGSMVVFNDEIHTARDVTKTHTSNVATFQSPAYGPIGFISKKEVSFHQPPNRGNTYSLDGKLLESSGHPEVPVVKAVTGMNPKWLQYLLDSPIDGVVLEAFGAGNVPPTIVPVVRTLIEKNVPVVMVSRCFNGYVQDVYGYEGGGRQLRNLGVILCPDLNAQKARIKLLILLAARLSITQIAAEF